MLVSLVFGFVPRTAFRAVISNIPDNPRLTTA
jgi:hypothetical protein